MYIAILLHCYQPPIQYSSMVRRITKQSYEKIIGLLEEFPKAKLTLNINASLSEQLSKNGFEDLIKRIAKLSESGRVELSGSAAYHPILPDLPKREIIRQINLNSVINQSYFGSAYRPTGFFPPELAFNEKVGEVVEKLGFRWILVDGTAIADWRKYLKVMYRRRGGRMLVIPREDVLSTRIAFGKIRTKLGLIRAIGAAQLMKREYVVLAMDGETFGHHLPGQLRFLKELFRMNRDDKRLRLVTVFELYKLFPEKEVVDLQESTWGYKELVDGKQVWVRWRNPNNPVHLVLNELRKVALESVQVKDREARSYLDRALNSDIYWWASGKPYWHPGMVVRGAELFYKAVTKSKTATIEQKRHMKYLYRIKLNRELTRMRTRGRRKKIFEGKS